MVTFVGRNPRQSFETGVKVWVLDAWARGGRGRARPGVHPSVGEPMSEPGAPESRILDAFEEAIVENGVQAASFARIAAIGGFHRTLVQHHFGTRASLTQALLDRLVDYYARRTLEVAAAAPVGERVAALLLGANNVYLTAVRASYALAYYFHYVGRMALPSLQLIPRHMNSAIDELNYADAGDVMIAISFTPYSRETIEACKFARKKGVKLVLISDSDVVSSDFTPDETLVASVISTHHFGCYAGAMAVIESLLALLVSLGGEDARERIRSYEDLRKENNAYWIAQKKH